MTPPDSTRNATSLSLHITRRNLPHWQRGGYIYFVTFRLKDSRGDPPGGTGFQPVLAPQERRIVKDCILHWHGTRWHVHAVTVMPDHVHILARPLEQAKEQWYPLSTILHSVKRHSARSINRLRARSGPLWQPESFDRIVRDEKEFHEKANYILTNAVKSGLVTDGWLYDGFWCEGMQGMPSAG